MKDEYKVLFKQLIDSYYNNSFEETFHRMMKQDFASRDEAREVLSTLCGVDLTNEKNDYDFIQSIIHAITTNQVREKIVQKVTVCSKDCETIHGKSRCQSVCPFDAILKDPIGNDKWIDESLCLNCGRCIASCDQGKYLDTPQFLPLAELLKTKQQVIAIVAPAIAGQYGSDVTLDQLREAFIMLGFTDMVEVAMAADVLSLKEAFEYNHHVHRDGDVMISSCCCPVWVAFLKKVYNQLMPDVSPSVSPMIAMGRILKAVNPDVNVVFIGPCVAKKAEAKEPDIKDAIDFVLTYQEVQTIFELFHIQPSTLQGIPSVDYASTGGRLYGRTGGVSQAVWDIVDQMFPNKRQLFKAVQADGIKDCKKLLDDLLKGNTSATFIEGMACPGGCVGGPKAIINRDQGRNAVNEIAYDSTIKIPVHNEVLFELLNRAGIDGLEELTEKGSMFERSFY